MQQDRRVLYASASLRQLSGLEDRILARAFLLYRKAVGMTISAGIFVGIDVAKEKLDRAVLGETQASQVGNDKKGIASLVKKMKKLAPELITVEATGGYQRAVVLRLYEAGLPMAVVNPQRVRQYARASGLLAKTDKLNGLR